MLSYNVLEVFVVGIFLADLSVSAPAPDSSPAPTSTPTTDCVDHFPTCQNFKGWGCGGQYEEWAIYNCAKTCGYCDKKRFTHSTHQPLSVTQPVPSQRCSDNIPNCKEYGQSVCTAYKTWAQDNCASYCNLCGFNTCQDKLPNCDMYGSETCGGAYRTWALDNCAYTCRLCDV
ncbi:putative tyrosinase-like protein tyr-1 isoform X2 [Haliotis rubra]|uniref:putative tyrosinase-like protein tyr-1 isoform X2 n=1 Tax=Haliotis rubra TaxID=36100 RepID=UPI001EE5389A|nr:putative tyrosinase-like protein tyr-1 isoform X2 [Haliotis rubra]